MGATGAGSAGALSGIQIVFLVLGILLAIGIVLGIIFFFALRKLRKLRDERVAEVRQTLKEDNIILMEPAANFFGQQSLGMTQARGTGTLVFSKDEIYFLMWLPKKEFRIPLNSIKKIETPKSHLGKTKGTALLKVTFANENGEEDSVAWQVKDLSGVKAQLEKIVQA